jgi:tRNA modification GTPase
VQASHALAAVQLAAQQQQGQRALAHAELIAADLHAAGSALGLLCGGTGSISPDEVLGKIFSTFCVGK